MSNLINITILFLILYYLLKDMDIVESVIQKGGSIPVTLSENGISPYTRQYREIDNVDNVLNRPLQKVNKYTARLHAANSWNNNDGTQRAQLELVEPTKRYLNFIDSKPEHVTPDIHTLVESKQPYFLDKANIIDYYGKKFYWDWRYPKEPLPIQFAHNPDKFVKENPNLYPSYIIRSRDLSQLNSY